MSRRHRLRITRRDLDRAMGDFSYGARDFMADAKDVVTSKPMIRQATSGMAAFGYGALEGAYGPLSLGPVAYDLLGAIVLHGAAFAGFLGGYTGHAHNVAQGLLDGHLARVGVGVGAAFAQRAATPKVSGTNPRGSYHIGTNARRAMPARGRGPLTEAEIAAMAQQVR